MFICPRARALPQSDIAEIARLVAEATPLTAYSITPPLGDDSLKSLVVMTVIPGREKDCADQQCFGSCTAEKVDGGWRVVDCIVGVSPFLWHSLRCL